MFVDFQSWRFRGAALYKPFGHILKMLVSKGSHVKMMPNKGLPGKT